MKPLISLFFGLLAAETALALTPAEWRGQSIYQVLTDRFARTDGSTTAECDTELGIYCGGSWQGIVNNLDYIQDMGFSAIWISPIVENLAGNSLDGEAYHGYWAQNIYEVNTNFGTASDIVALSDALHDRGMFLMVDVVTNHMGFLGAGDDVDYSIFNPFNEESYFHPFCLIDFDDASTIETCWEGDNTVSLPDLATEDSNVLSMWETWITQLVANYSIDGLRVDSAYEVDPAFFPGFQSAAGVYIVGEVDDGDPNIVCSYQDVMSGVLNYPAYSWITEAFETVGTTTGINNLVAGINQMKETCADTTLLGSFLENHDNPRFPSLTQDFSLAKNAIAFAMLADGIPIIYEGQEQHYDGGGTPNQREAIWLSDYSTSAELYGHIASLNQIRNQAILKDVGYLTYQAFPIYSDDTTIAMRKGDDGFQIVGVFSNLGADGATYTFDLPSSDTGFTAGEVVIEVLSCTSFTVDSSGDLAVAMSGGLPRVFFPLAQLEDSGICSSVTGGGAPTTPPSTTCKLATVPITFTVLEATTFGETMLLTGSIPALGDWSTDVEEGGAIAMSASEYTASHPIWSVTVDLVPATAIQYKFINEATNGADNWEADPNRSLTIPCAATTVAGTFQQT